MKFKLYILPILGCLCLAYEVAKIQNKGHQLTLSEDGGGLRPPAKAAEPNFVSIKETNEKSDLNNTATLDTKLLEHGYQNVEDAISYVNKNYPREERARALSFLLSRVGQQTLTAINKIAPLIGDKNLKTFALCSIAEHWIKTDLAVAEKYAENGLSGSLKNEFFQSLANSLNNNGKYLDAAAIINKMPYSEARTDVINQTAMRFASSDADAAILWALTLPIDEDIGSSQRFLEMQFARDHNMDALKTLASKTADNGVRKNALKDYGKLYVNSNGADFSSVLNYSSESDKSNVLTGVIEASSPSDLAKVGEVVLSLKEQENIASSVNAYIARLFSFNPEDAVLWADKANGDHKQFAIRSLVRVWYDTDSVALSEWVGKIPKGDERDIALDAMAARLASTDKKAALEIALQISNQKLKKSLEIRLGK